MKGVTGMDTSKFAKKADIATLKFKVDKIDVVKIGTVPANLNKLNNTVGYDVVNNMINYKC